MIVYTVYEPRGPAQDLEERAGNVVFIKEGFIWWGFFLGPLWLLLQGLWLALILTLILSAALAAGLIELGLKDDAPGIITLLLMLLIGFEGNNLRRWSLERRGYIYVTSVAGRDTEECERRFFDAWLPVAAGPPKANAPHAPGAQPPSQTAWPDVGVVGTLPGS